MPQCCSCYKWRYPYYPGRQGLSVYYLSGLRLNVAGTKYPAMYATSSLSLMHSRVHFLSLLVDFGVTRNPGSTSESVLLLKANGKRTSLFGYRRRGDYTVIERAWFEVSCFIRAFSSSPPPRLSPPRSFPPDPRNAQVVLWAVPTLGSVFFRCSLSRSLCVPCWFPWLSACCSLACSGLR